MSKLHDAIVNTSMEIVMTDEIKSCADASPLLTPSTMRCEVFKVFSSWLAPDNQPDDELRTALQNIRSTLLVQKKKGNPDADFLLSRL